MRNWDLVVAKARHFTSPLWGVGQTPSTPHPIALDSLQRSGPQSPLKPLEKGKRQAVPHDQGLPSDAPPLFLGLTHDIDPRRGLWLLLHLAVPASLWWRTPVKIEIEFSGPAVNPTPLILLWL